MGTVETPQLYKVYKVGRKSYRKKVLAKNISRDAAIAMVNTYKDSNRSMVVFDKM